MKLSLWMYPKRAPPEILPLALRCFPSLDGLLLYPEQFPLALRQDKSFGGLIPWGADLGSRKILRHPALERLDYVIIGDDPNIDRPSLMVSAEEYVERALEFALELREGGFQGKIIAGACLVGWGVQQAFPKEDFEQVAGQLLEEDFSGIAISPLWLKEAPALLESLFGPGYFFENKSLHVLGFALDNHSLKSRMLLQGGRYYQAMKEAQAAGAEYFSIWSFGPYRVKGLLGEYGLIQDGGYTISGSYLKHDLERFVAERDAEREEREKERSAKGVRAQIRSKSG